MARSWHIIQTNAIVSYKMSNLRGAFYENFPHLAHQGLQEPNFTTISSQLPLSANLFSVCD
jgi:hypothetical protein